MPLRPTVEGLGHATYNLEALAFGCTANNANGYHQAIGLLDLLVFIDTELAHHRRASAYGPGSEASPEGGGTIGRNTIGRHGLNRPTEARLDFGAEKGRNQRGGTAQPPVEPNDPVYKDLRRFQRDVISTLTSLQAQYEDRLHRIAGWPHRSEATA